MSRLPIVAFHALALVFVVGGCGVGPGGDREFEPVVEARTMFLEELVGDAEVEVFEDRLVMELKGREDLLDAADGRVIVSARHGGLLRHLDDAWTEGDRLVIKTSPALLTDAVEDGDASPVQGGQAGRNVATSALSAALDWNVDLARLSRGRRIPVADSASLSVVSGHMNLRSAIDMDLSIRRRRVQRFAVNVTGDADMAIELKLQGRAAFDDRYGVDLWESPPKYLTWWIGYVPVVMAVRAKVRLEGAVHAGGAASVVTSTSVQADLDAGLAYDAGQGWSTAAAVDLDMPAVKISGDARSSASIEAKLTVRLETKLYGVAGPWISPIGPYAKAASEGAPLCLTTLSAGVSGAAGVSVAKLPFRLGGGDVIHKTLYTRRLIEKTQRASWMAGCGAWTTR